MPSTEPEHDLSTIAGAQAYLSSTPFASTSLTLLSGIHSNFTYRLYLVTPYKGQSTLVMKHAKPHIVLSATEILYAMERQTFEAKALQKIREGLDCEPRAATVPEMHHFDAEAHVIILEDCGEQSRNLKELFLTAPPPPAIAHEIGLALGQFLGRLHAWGAADPAILDVFAGNEQAKRITSWITYERLIPTLTTDNVPAVALLPAPIPETDLAAIRALVAERIPEIYAARAALTMGDFWTGNVVVRLDGADGAVTPRVHVIDWELVKPGIPALDVGQFCAEMHTLTLFRPQTAASAGALIDAFLTAYRAHCGSLAPHTANVATKHMGAHLVVITPSVGWGTPEENVKAIELGLTYMREGGSDQWVRESSVFGSLM
ncbi:kinase-like domain-containing protein [Mycena maculata]|uniref:Kinase-like domain-containing protein n=1 Tax=Mycena maculata TaxID=230809 RepID=A0AAD7N2X2_9AGAR|nr:kinase-like domain-containing protein [Mycena maculata]